MRLVIPVQLTVELGGERMAQLGKRQYERAWQQGRVQDAIRDVMSRTVLRRYRQLVLEHLPVLLEPERLDSSGSPLEGASVGFSTSEQKQMLKLLERRDAANRTGNSAELRQIAESMEGMQRTLTKRLEARGDRTLATGLFRPRLQEVLNILTDPDQVALWRESDGTVKWGIGRLTTLQKSSLRIPSFAEYRRKQRTRSKQGQPLGRKYDYPKAFMWKHIEYGSGDVKRGRGPWSFGSLTFGRVRGVNGFGRILAMMKGDAVQQQLTQAILKAVRGG